MVELNRPVLVTDPATGRALRLFQSSFGGPYRPGDGRFEQQLGGREKRDELFESIFTVAYDPGRQLKYAGCLMIVAGIAVMYYMKAYFFRRRGPREPATGNVGGDSIADGFTRSTPCFAERYCSDTAVALGFRAGGGSRRGTARLERLAGDAGAGRRPGHAAGYVGAIGGRGNLRANQPAALAGRGCRGATADGVAAVHGGRVALQLAGRARAMGDRALSGGRQRTVARGHTRIARPRPRGQPAEARLAPAVRGLAAGGRPARRVGRSAAQGRSGGQEVRSRRRRRSSARLNEAYGTYRILTFDPESPAVRRTRFLDRLYEVVTTWRQEIEPNVRPWRGLGKEDPLGDAVDQSARAIDELVELLRKDDFTLADAEPPASRLCEATASLAREVAAMRDRAFETTAGPEGQSLADARATINALGSRAKRLARQARSLRTALYDNGRSLRVVPALNPWAFEARPRPGRRPPAVAQSPDAAFRFARGSQGLSGRQGGRGARGVRGGEGGVHSIATRRIGRRGSRPRWTGSSRRFVRWAKGSSPRGGDCRSSTRTKPCWPRRRIRPPDRRPTSFATTGSIRSAGPGW